MRFHLGLSVMLFVVACSGATTTELFSGDATPAAESAPTEPEAPGPSEGAPAAHPIEKKEDAAGPVDAAKPETKDAAAEPEQEPEPVKCSFDSECKGDEVCNWKTDTCAEPGPLGSACKRDLECTGGLCNWKLQACSDPAPAGTACRRHKECASGACGGNSTCK